MTPMFTLFPRRWNQWLLFLFGPMFLAAWLPWSLQAFERIASAYLILLL